MTLQVFTARMGYKADSDWLDVTRSNKTATDQGGHLGIGLAFAPSSRLLRFYLERRRSEGLTDREWLEYVEAYTGEMRDSYKRNRAPWDTLLSAARRVLLCYCPDATRCHRTILARDILPKLGAQYRGELS
jgi:hypothetical protein